MSLPKIISLFSGPGGLDLGFDMAGYETALAIDKSFWAVETHKLNFPEVPAVAADLVELGVDGVARLVHEQVPIGSAIGVIGGPPCQAFSRSNPFSQSDDPRNALPRLYLEIVNRLQKDYDVKFVLFENVLGIRDKRHAITFSAILDQLDELNLKSNVAEYHALKYGVPQDRRRIIISAFSHGHVDMHEFVQQVPTADSSVRGAIAHLPEPTYFRRGIRASDIPFHANHWTMQPVSAKFRDPSLRLKNSRSFRQLDWDRPSPTVAYGHREIHIHPAGHRRLSILEAMLLQGFPASFELLGPLSAQVEQVSNAVPPPMAFKLALAVADALPLSSN